MNSSIKILTLNIGNPSLERVKRQIAWLNQRDDDIIVLSETKNSTGCNYLADNFLQTELSLFSDREQKYVVFPTSTADQYGVMVISKFPIVESILPFPVDSPYYCRQVECRIQINGRMLDIIGIYVPSRDQTPQKIARKKEYLENAIQFIKKINNPSTVICGDFNIVDRNHFPHYSFFRKWEYDFYDQLLQIGYVDAYKYLNQTMQEYSWVGRTNDGYRYDYIFASNPLSNRILHCKYIHETRLQRITDHSAVMMELTCK